MKIKILTRTIIATFIATLLPNIVAAQFSSHSKTFVRDTATLKVLKNFYNMVDTCSVPVPSTATVGASSITDEDRSEPIFDDNFESFSNFPGWENSFIEDSIYWDILSINDTLDNDTSYEASFHFIIDSISPPPPCPISEIVGLNFYVKMAIYSSDDFALAAFVNDTNRLTGGQSFQLYDLITGSDTVVRLSIDAPMPSLTDLQAGLELAMFWDDIGAGIDYVWAEIIYHHDCSAALHYLSLPVSLVQQCDEAIRIETPDTLNVRATNQPARIISYCDVGNTNMAIKFETDTIANTMGLKVYAYPGHDDLQSIYILWGNGLANTPSSGTFAYNTYNVPGRYIIRVIITTLSAATFEYHIPIIYDGSKIIIPIEVSGFKDEHAYQYVIKEAVKVSYNTDGSVLSKTDYQNTPYTVAGKLYVNCPENFTYQYTLNDQKPASRVQIYGVTGGTHTIAANTAHSITYTLTYGTSATIDNGAGITTIPANDRVFTIEAQANGFIANEITIVSDPSTLVYLQIVR